MLRTSLRSVRALGSSPVAVARARLPVSSVSAVTRRFYADDKKPIAADVPKPVTPPVTKPIIVTPPPRPRRRGHSSSRIEQDGSSPPPPPAKPKKGIFRRLKNLLVTLVILGAVGFSGGVYYARINDKFHDIFTEYVPFGEQAVLYLEELDFRRKFPDSSDRVSSPRPNDKLISVAPLSGASWRVADGGEPAGRRSSALDKVKAGAATAKKEASKAKETAEPVVAAPATPVVKAVEPKKTEPEPIVDAKEPVIQDLVHMLNDLITVINADKAHGRYGTTVTKAKNDLAKVGRKIQAMKEQIEQKAAAEVKAKVEEFDQAANALVTKVESTMVAQERQWREEFEEEMVKVREGYENRVNLLLERERQLHEEKIKTKLIEQAVALKKEFIAEVKSQVESERDGRLGKLKDLSSAINELETLTTGWNDVVDLNIKTQQLHVAGISTPAQLIDRFRRVASEVRKASLLPEDAGVASHATSWALSKVMFKKEGLAAGDDVESILTRTQTLLEEGDLDSAAREMNGLDGWAKTLSRDWLSEVRKVLEVRQALDVIAAEARLQSLRTE
ncbi:unnamed protein product [Parascedosporium putredinis]|uniref:MICOS complex subunit MIC60 n=1 Tax=Parascedosporium putredinis TaxID=1442378 RepID=A0A9P1HB08_9PEZI|nr:unnamed protein product [Parascedosporium putredinis]CAI8001848.1 unnamed protein product [Parascedosporium putredinis]